MKRRIIQIGNSTQLISLPRKWAQHLKLQKGEELEIEEQGNRLLISTEKDPDIGTVEIDITDLDRTSIIFLIRGLYKKGYDEIRLLFKKPMCFHYRVNKPTKIITAIHTETNRLTGMEIVQQKENLCILKTISKPSDKELDSIIRRIYILLNDAVGDFIAGAKVNDQIQLETIQEKHDTLTKFISYSLRIMNKFRTGDVNSYFLYHILATLDKITDLLKICSRDLQRYNKKLQKDSVKILDMIQDSFVKYQSLFYQFNLATARALSENKELIDRQIAKVSPKLPSEEVLMLSNMHQSLELFRDLTESRMAMAFWF